MVIEIEVNITCRPVRGSQQGNDDDDDEGDSVGDVGDDGNAVYANDSDHADLAGLCGAQSGAGEKKLSDVTLSKASNGSKVRCHFYQGLDQNLKWV